MKANVIVFDNREASSTALAELEQLEREGDVTTLRRWVTSKQAEMFRWLTRVNHALQ